MEHISTFIKGWYCMCSSIAVERVLRWFGHVDRMDEYHMARSVLMAEVNGGRVRGILRLAWMDGVKVALGNRGMMVEAAC